MASRRSSTDVTTPDEAVFAGIDAEDRKAVCDEIWVDSVG
jgi:hypothetical protein